jgi:hypothetical protein
MLDPFEQETEEQEEYNNANITFNEQLNISLESDSDGLETEAEKSYKQYLIDEEKHYQLCKKVIECYNEISEYNKTNGIITDMTVSNLYNKIKVIDQ